MIGRLITRSQRNDFFEIQVTSLIISFILFFMAWVARVGLEGKPPPMLLVLATSVILFPTLLSRFLSLPFALLQLITLLFFFTVGWLSIVLSTDFSIIIYTVCLFSIFYFLRDSLFSGYRWKKVGVACFLGFALANLTWGPDYLNPLAPEAYAAGLRFTHVDTLFLSAVTSSIRTYQFVSTGLAGLVPLTYHSGSNFLFASLAQLCDISVLQFYHVAYPVIFIPLFIQSVLIAASAGIPKISSSKLVIILVLLFFILTGFGSAKFGSRYLLPWALNHHFVSQSYCVSLIVLMLVTSLYLPLLTSSRVHTNTKINNTLLLLIPVWIFIIGLIKISTAAILIAVFGYLVVRRRKSMPRLIFISAAISLVVFYIVLRLTTEPAQRELVFQWAAFYKMNLNGNLLLYFLLRYLPLLVFGCLVVFVNKAQAPVSRAAQLLALEITIVSAVVGLLPGMLIHIEGGSAYYFADVQHWFCLIGILSLVPQLSSRFKFANTTGRARTVMVMLAVATTILLTREAYRSCYNYVKKNMDVRTKLAYGHAHTFNAIKASMSLDDILTTLIWELQKSQGYRDRVQSLRLPLFDSLRNLPSEIRSSSVTYLKDPMSLESFLSCAEATFYLNSMSELATLNGLFWADNCYQIEAYGMRSYANRPTIVSEDEIYSAAFMGGFDYVIFINFAEGSFKVFPLDRMKKLPPAEAIEKRIAR